VIEIAGRNAVDPNFARTLERANAALRADLNKTTTELSLWRDGEIVREEDQNEVAALRVSKALAEGECTRLRAEVDALISDRVNPDLLDERNQLLAEVERLKAACDKFSNSEIEQGDWKQRAERAEAALRSMLPPSHGVYGGPLCGMKAVYEDGTDESTARHTGFIPHEVVEKARAATANEEPCTFPACGSPGEYCRASCAATRAATKEDKL
jgi:hypothetical protein